MNNYLSVIFYPVSQASTMSLALLSDSIPNTVKSNCNPGRKTDSVRSHHRDFLLET